MIILGAVCRRMFKYDLVRIRSKAARQKFLRKNVKKNNKDEFKDAAIELIMEIIHDERQLWLAHGIISRIIDAIADRVQTGEPEPYVDNFENELGAFPSSSTASPQRDDF